VEGGGTPGEARAAAPCQEPAEETLGCGVLGRRSATPPARGPERTNGGEAAADGTEGRNCKNAQRRWGERRASKCKNSPDLSGAFRWGSGGLC